MSQKVPKVLLGLSSLSILRSVVALWMLLLLLLLISHKPIFLLTLPPHEAMVNF